MNILTYKIKRLDKFYASERQLFKMLFEYCNKNLDIITPFLIKNAHYNL